MLTGLREVNGIVSSMSLGLFSLVIEGLRTRVGRFRRDPGLRPDGGPPGLRVGPIAYGTLTPC